MNIIKAGKYAGALIAISTVLSGMYHYNAWASDLDSINISQKKAILGMEKRVLTRSILQWSTKPANTLQEKQYKNAIVEQLKADKEDIGIKMRSLGYVKE